MKKITLSGVSGDAILLTIIKLVTMAVGLAVTRLLSQYLSVYDYGTYSQILLIVSVVSSITIMGMMDGMNFFYCSERDDNMREAYVSSIFALQCIVSAIAGTGVIILSGPLCQHLENPDLKRLLFFAVSLPFLQNLLFMFQVLLVAVGKAKMLAIRNLVVSLARLVAVIFVVAVTKNVLVFLTTTVVLDMGQIVFFGWTLKKNNCHIRYRSVNAKLFTKILRYCVPMGIFVTLKSTNRDLDKYLIALLTDTETLAVYANASKPLPFDILMYSFYTVLVPKITRHVTAGEQEQAQVLYKDFLEIAYLVTVVPCFAALAASPQLMKLLYSNKYMVGLPIFCIYILVDMLQFTNITLILSAAGRAKMLMLLAGAMLALNAILDTALYQWVGIIGPAWATLIVTFSMGLLLLAMSAKELGAKLVSLFDMKFLLLFILENGILCVFLSHLQKKLVTWDFHYVLILFLICALYCGCFVLLHGRRLLKLMKRINNAGR